MSGQSAVLLEGSCHCGSVKFRVESSTPYPYQACYCSICRETAVGGRKLTAMSGRQGRPMLTALARYTRDTART